MTTEQTFTPQFKEKGNEKYFYKDDKWISCGEQTVDSLWWQWVESKGAVKFTDDDGFLVFGCARDK